MGFSVQFSTFDSDSNISRQLYYFLMENEDNGQKEITFYTKNRLDKLKINQVIHYKNNHSEKDVEPKRIYKVKDIITSSNTNLENNRLVLEEIEQDYIPKKRFFLTTSDLYEYKSMLKEKGYEAGKFLISGGSTLAKISDFVVSEEYDNELIAETLNNPHRESVFKDCFRIKIKKEGTGLKRYNILKDFCSEELIKDDELLDKWYLTEHDDYESLIKHNDELFLLGEYKEHLRIGEEEKEEGNSLVGFGDSKHLKVIADSIDIKRKKLEGNVYVKNRSVMLMKEEIERQTEGMMANINKVKTEMEFTVRDLNTKVKGIMRLVTTLEIFAGVTEEIKQIKFGEDSSDRIINLIQRKLFMDEEVAVWENGGIDFRNIDGFDSWVAKDNNIDRLIGTERGILIMGVRRSNVRYYDDAFLNSMANEGNKKIYILIKNGGNVYRLWSDKIETHGRLFPKESELNEIVRKIQDTQFEVDNAEERYDRIRKSEELEKAKDDIFYYRRNFILLQGLIARTEIFKDFPSDFNIMNVENHKGYINYVYDEEMVLGDGIKDYDTWIADINSKVRRGKKILLFLANKRENSRDYRYRYNVYFDDKDYNIPNLPPFGIYTVKSERMEHKKQIFHWIPELEFMNNQDKWEKAHYGYNIQSKYVGTVKHVEVKKKNPEDSEFVTETSEKLFISFFQEKDYYTKYNNQWIRFIIEPNDDFFISYEDIDESTIDYYLENREARRKYLKMIPLLTTLKEEIKKDKEIEEHYVNMVYSHIIRDYGINLKESSIKSEISKAILKWRTGIVYENSLNTLVSGSINETKAVKNIIQESLRTIKKEFKIDIDLGVNARLKLQKIKPNERRGYHEYFAFGLNKKEFVDVVSKNVYDNKTNSKKKLNTIIEFFEDEKITKYLKENKDVIIASRETIGFGKTYYSIDVNTNLTKELEW